jgi:hypothetical protein
MDYLTPPNPGVQRAGSLLAAADTPTQGVENYFAQIGYWAPACTGWRLYDPCGDGDPIDHDSDVTGAVVQGTPVPIQVFDDCPSTFASRDEQGRRQYAVDRLGRVESAAIAHEFWTGEMATEAGWDDNPRLAAGDIDDDGLVTIVSADALSIVAGLAALEDALAGALAGAPGALHMTRGTLPHVDAAGITLTRNGFNVETLTDHRVIADAGYPGTGPDGAAADAGEAWIYATARPTVWRSAVEPLGPALDRDVNSLQASAQKFALTLISCGVFAARVTLT